MRGRRAASPSCAWLITAALTFGGCGGASSVGPTPPQPTPQPTPQPFDRQSFVEALFLGTGPYSDANSPGRMTELGRMAGWVDVIVRVRISTGLSEADQQGVLGPLGQLEEATAGAVRVTVATTDEIDPLPRFGEITVAKLPDGTVDSICGTPGAVACVQTTGLLGVIWTARIVARQSATSLTYAHEVGHAAFGMCHINPTTAVYRNGPNISPSTIMGNGVLGEMLTTEDLTAVRSVYAAGLRGGSSRAAFVSAGLIAP